MADFKMPNMNTVSVIGRLCRDGELKDVGSTNLLKMTVVVSKKYKTKNGEQREDTAFIDVTLWGQSAEWLAEYAVIGAPVLVEGSLKQENWEDSDGNKQSKLIINAQRVQTLSWDDTSPKKAESDGQEDDPIGEPEIPF